MPQYYSRRSTPGMRISLELDPQNILNGSLRIASREGRTHELQTLLKSGADSNSTSDSGETALMLASRNCYPKAVEILLQHNADVNAKDTDGRTALIFAASDSCAKVVELLVKKNNIDLNAKDHIQKSALDYAKDNSILEVGGPSERIINLIQAAKKKGTHRLVIRNKMVS